MKAHNLEAIGFLKLHYTPTEPNHAVRKEDLDALKSETSSKPIFVTGVAPQNSGNVGNKQYADTTPLNSILVSCVSDTEELRISFQAESRQSFVAPQIEARMGDTVLGVPSVIENVEGNSQLFRGHIDITMTESGLVTLHSSAGTMATVDIIVAALGPVVTSVVIDSLPAGQTRVKEDDVLEVSGTVDNSAVAIEVVDFGAGKSGEFELSEADSGGPGYRSFAGTVLVSNRTGLNPVRLVGRNQIGTLGATRDSSNVRLDQAPPAVALSFGPNSNNKDYLGVGDTVQVTLTLTNVDSMEFEFLYGDEGGSKTALLTQRTLTVQEAVYNDEGGIVVRAIRTANGTSFEQEFDIRIASLALKLEALDIEGSVLRANSRIIPSVPVFGEHPSTRLSASDLDSLVNELPNTDNQDFFLEAYSGYGYFAYPAALGEATFVDLSTGMVGGFDGATWPEDGSVGNTYGPRTVVLNGVNWFVYRTDYPGTVAPFMVTFQNPGLSVGESDLIPHLMSSPDGETYVVRLVFNQGVFEAPQLTAGAGVWSGEWAQDSDDPAVWERTLVVRNSDSRGQAYFTDLSVLSASGEHLQDINGKADYVIAGFASRIVTFSAFARSAAIGVRVYNVTRTRARYAGSTADLALRTDTRDARSSYSIVDGEGDYAASMGTHIWLSDADFAAANTTGTLQVEIEELP